MFDDAGDDIEKVLARQSRWRNQDGVKAEGLIHIEPSAQRWVKNGNVEER